MMNRMPDLDPKLVTAVKQFWSTRASQGAKQGAQSGVRDQGSRTDVTGGAHLGGFASMIRGILAECGLHDSSIHYRVRRQTYLPGFFRPTKSWDLVVVADDQLVASVEFKSQVGSFGNNFNNRTEEALGNATDILTAFREGAFGKTIHPPWLGFFMLLEDCPASTAPVGVEEPHFPVFAEFRGASYAQRYEILCRKLVREKLYDAACLVLSSRDGGARGEYREMTDDTSFRAFEASLCGRITAFQRLRG